MPFSRLIIDPDFFRSRDPISGQAVMNNGSYNTIQEVKDV
jgi:hypothetical protein